MTDPIKPENAPENAVVPVASNGLQITQELQVMNKDITYIGVARRETQLIDAGNQVDKAREETHERIDQLKTDLMAALLARAREQFLAPMSAACGLLRGVGFELAEPKVEVQSSVEDMNSKDGGSEVQVLLALSDGTSSYRPDTLSREVRMNLTSQDRKVIKAISQLFAHSQKLVAAANRVKVERQNLGSWERQLAAKLAENTLRQSATGDQVLKVIDGMPAFKLPEGLEAPALDI